MTRSAAATRERNVRGSAKDRRTRKLWMLSPVSGFGGNGTSVPCVHCGRWCSFVSVEADRKIPGGSYRRDNIQPACKPCNLSRSNNVEWDGRVSVAALALA